MHIAILVGHFPPGAFGGAELQAEGWAMRLVDRHRVTVITRAEPVGLPAREERDGFTVLRLHASPVPLWRTLADIVAIGRALASQAPRPDVLLCFQTFISGLAGVRAGRRLSIPAVVWIRGEEEYLLGRLRMNRMLSPAVWRNACAVLVQSEQNRVDLLRELEAHAPGVLAGVRAKLHIVANGLDLPTGPFPLGPRVLSVGRLIFQKGMDVVIDAAVGCGASLTIAGEGPERPALEQRAHKSRAKCRFEGHVSRARLDTLYREASCVVLAARFGEGLPNVLLEAMSYARPVIASRCAGTRDLLVDGVNGLLVAPGDTSAVRAAIERVTRDLTFAARLGAAARRTVESYAWDRVRPGLEAVLAAASPGAGTIRGGAERIRVDQERGNISTVACRKRGVAYKKLRQLTFNPGAEEKRKR